MNPKGKRPDGQIRRSQVLTTAGPGALVDLVDDAVIIKGPDDWHYPNDGEGFIQEPRLERSVLAQLRATARWPRANVRLRLPPVSDDESVGPHRGIHAREFPAWFLCQGCQSLVGREVLDGRRWHRCSADPKQKPAPAVPIRFVAACRRGHINDIHWRYFLHPGPKPEGVEAPFRCAIDPARASDGLDARGERPTADLQLRTEGTTGELADLVVACRRCGARRSLQELSHPGALGSCPAWRPWLNRNDEECTEQAKLLVRTATNAWFPLNLSVLHLGDDEDNLKHAIDKHWALLSRLETEEDLQFASRRLLPEAVVAALQAFEPAEVIAQIRRKAAGLIEHEPPLREVEWRALTSAPYGLSEDLPPRGKDWFATRITPTELPAQIDRVVLIPALKEVTAQTGFLRLEGFEADAEGGITPDPDRVAPLSLRQDWVPAVEQRGEGFFIGFDEAALRAWEDRPAVRRREALFRRALQDKNRADARPDAPFGGARLLMLHSLSHMLIRAISLECGYSAAAIRERIYCFRAPEPGPGEPPAPLSDSRAGILLYTGTPGSEGTLGGLVDVGRNIAQHLRAALEMNRLCSNDPVCAQHRPTALDNRAREGAACHGCLLIAEPSCERMNRDLDRAFVVPTVDEDGVECAFFGAWMG